MYFAIIILVAALAAALFIIYSLVNNNRRLAADNAGLVTDLAVARRTLEMERAASGDRLRAMANEVMLTAGTAVADRSRLGVEAVLAPVKEAIDTFTRDFKACYDSDLADRSALRERIDTLQLTGQRIGDETSRLTHALKGDKGFQGRWGEMMLANVLEHSGLEEGRWVCYQHQSTTDEGRRLRPDAVVKLPGDRCLIIDAKCPLSAYNRMAEADDETIRRAEARAHVQAIDAHIKTLASRAYHDNSGSAESAAFTVMFLPHEGAFITAMQTDGDLWQRAFDARVIIASPVHLATLVKLAEQMWVNTDRSANARRIAEDAARMLDKLVGAYEDLDRVGQQLDRAHEAYEAAVSKLRTGKGNVSRRIAALSALGVRVSKDIPQRLRDTESDEE